MERIQLISPCNSSCVAHFPCSVLLLVVTDGLLKGQIKSWDDQEISRVLRRIAISSFKNQLSEQGAEIIILKDDKFMTILIEING
ncbi:hypothetical protein ACS0TY_023934 [Phlomoides rotata]